MPYTLNGFGTRYYGRRDPADDGSYITTLWITALYVPILPLGSYRVLPVGQGTNWVVHRSQNYHVLRIPLCWDQVWHVYMIGAPILILIGWLVWTSVKQDRIKDDLQARLKTAAQDISRVRLDVHKVEETCLGWFNSPDTPHKKLEVLHDELRDRCASWPAAEDNYAAKVIKFQDVAREVLAGNAIEGEDRTRLVTTVKVFDIRRHQTAESKQMAECMANFSQSCYENVFTLQDAMQSEDKQACSMLASIGEKCK